MLNKKIINSLLLSNDILLLGGYFLYHFGVVNTNKSKLNGIYNSLRENKKEENLWYKNVIKHEWHIISNDGLVLRSTYIPNDSNKFIILFHGLRHSREQMIPYAKIFYELKFNIVMPDARAHGLSEGKKIGYGWLDRIDCLNWIEKINSMFSNCSIVLMGISMGAGTVLAASGGKLPYNVTAIISDSGYGSLKREGKYRLIHHYHVPPFPFMYISNFFMKILAGYSYEEANIDNEVKKNKVPLFLIQGKKDKVVPVREASILYKEDSTYKLIYLNGKSHHVQTFRNNERKYCKLIYKFLQFSTKLFYS